MRTVTAWGPHGVDRRRRSCTPVPSGQKHWMGGAAWQPDLWPLAGSVPRLSLHSSQESAFQPSSQGSSCWCYLGTKVGLTFGSFWPSETLSWCKLCANIPS